MSHLIFDLQELYQQTFGGKPYHIEGQKEPGLYSEGGQPLTADYLGQEIWLPVTFFDLDPKIFSFSQILLPYTVVKVSGKKTIVKTPLSERKGTVKELYNVEDYSIDIKGFLIDPKRVWPEQQLRIIKYLFESGQSVGLDNPLTNIYLINPATQTNETGSMQRVVVEDLELPEVSGGKKHVRPFSMKLESDSVFTLELLP